MGESKAAEAATGGGGITKVSLVSLALTVLLGALVTAAFFYLQLSVRTENEALRHRIESLDRQLTALSDAVVQLNNKTQELIRKREEDQRRTYKDEEDVETEAEYEDDMDPEYDDPNEDDSEYEEEEEEDYDLVQPKGGAAANKEERSKRSSKLSDEADLRVRDRLHERHSTAKNYRKIRRLKISDGAGIQMKQKKMDSIVEDKYPVIRRKRGNNRRQDVEVFTQNMTPQSSELIAAHFGADETKCLNQHHLRHYCDINHRRYHPGGVIQDWNTIFSSSSALNMREGKLTVNNAGLYFVYAQVFYSNAHDVNSFRIIHNEQSIMQCTTYTNHNTNSAPRYSCFTGALAYLAEGDHLYVRDIEERRHTLFERTKTFFGLFKVGNTLMV
ncbi:protein eiger [Nilaparvata lugens]|uniref:protein eiger n=1 Tax=Nilaparvata lugens TaxID=108931 RepID=UPI00193CD3CE|nr:protein eiger [Nilaparvata lugens]